MAKYTIEDIEILRQKSGISYEEAVNLLEYHNGSLARALVDLEKNGRIKSNTASSANHKGFRGVFDFLFRLRIRVKKKTLPILNLSALFCLFVLMTAPHVCVVGLIVSLVLGYRITIERDSQDFAEDNFDGIVKNARENVQQTVAGFAKQFSQNAEKQTEQTIHFVGPDGQTGAVLGLAAESFGEGLVHGKADAEDGRSHQ